MRATVTHKGRYQLHNTRPILNALYPDEYPPRKSWKGHPSYNLPKTCPQCGREYGGQRRQVCCSVGCSKEWQKKRKARA